MARLYNGEQITVTWEDAFKLSEKRIIVIVYMVKDPISGMFFSVPDEQYPQRPLFVVTGVWQLFRQLVISLDS